MRFTELFIAPRFYSFSPAVHQRVLTVVDFRSDGVVDWEEFVCYLFVLDYASREQRMRFVFNLFDLTGNGRIDREKLKRMSLALMTSTTAPAPSTADPSKDFSPLLDLFAYFALHSYDRDADRSLSFMEWRLYAEDDERVRRMVDEISSRRARRKEREARLGPQPRNPHHHRQPQQPTPPAKQNQPQAHSHGSESADEDDEGDDDWLTGEADDDDDAGDLDAANALGWSEWMGSAVVDESEWSAWEEYRNHMRTAANRMTTPTMEALDEERRRGGGGGGGGGGEGAQSSGLPPLPPSSSASHSHTSRPAPAGAAAGSPPHPSSTPSGHPHVASTRSPLLQTTTRSLVSSVAGLRGKK